MQEDMEEDCNTLCVAQSLSREVTDEPHGNEMTFDYLDMIERLQHSLDIPTINTLCEYFNMTSSLERIRANDKPRHHFLLECRRNCIITGKDTTKLLEAFRENGLSNLQGIIEDYNHISKFPDVRVTVNNDNPTSLFSRFKTFMLSKKRAIKSVFTRDKGIHFVDCQEGSLVICLKVSYVETLDKLKEDIESGELLRRLMAIYESEISDTERKDFQLESSSMKISYDTEEFENAKQQLTTNNARFRRSKAITKSVTQTTTETIILQEEMGGFHPPSVVQSLSEAGCSATSEETQTRIEATTSQEDMEEYFDAPGVVTSLSDADNGESEEDFIQYLDIVGLKDYFPRKLTMKEATEVRLFPSDDPKIKRKDLPFMFISKLTSLDSRITWKENLHIEGSVRDFIYAILHCSDNHLRQHLLEKFASCQLAVPVLLPGVRDDAKPELLTWALNRVVKKWKENETSLAPEKRMVSEPVFTTAFIRFGKIPISKSSVLNNVIGRAQGNETFRNFLSYEDEKEYVYQCCGSVEAQWYLPMYGRKEELLKEVTLLLNLRGDSKEFTTETQFICSIANATFLFVDKDKLEYYKTAIDALKKRCKNVFVIHLISQKETEGRLTWKQQLGRKSKKRKSDYFDDSVNFGVERNKTELAKVICEKIVQVCVDTSREHYCSIESWQTQCINDINVDHCNDYYSKAKQLLESSFPTQKSIEEVKKSYLQLQVEWVKWVEADKKPLCVGVQSVDHQFEAKEETKRDIRRIQRQIGLSAEMEIFWENLQTVMLNENDLLHYFMSFFRTQIEMMVAREIPPLVKRIDVLNASLQKKKSAMKQATSSERSELQNEIKELQQQLLKESGKVSAKNISCEHFIRELGHWYEASLENTHFHERNELLVNLASKLLLAGYPLELLDGETAYIPIKWISGVLMNLSNTLKNPNIFVLSIIGIQSSGKSTLLNSMFGVRFPVRAGRCTRGLYLQLVEVNAALHKQVGCKYLLIIDTEGLHSPDRTVLNDHRFDNSIATLVMCIGDLTLLNIGQETIGPDMIGILQIVVHAMIRMKKVNLVSNCRIIQQRVSDIAAAANNKSNMAKIKDALNKVTRTAAAEEKVDDIHDFSDVFPMVEEDDLQFFPCLWTGLMSPPNHGYSDQIHALKSAILLQNTTSITPPQFTMEKFISRLTDVWEAVKSEDFVFNFQNSFDALSNQRFRLQHNILIGEMRTDLTEWELKNSNNLSSATKDDFFRRGKIEINKKCETVNEKIDEYVKAHNDEAEVKRRQQSIKNETLDIGRDIQRAIEVNTEILLQNKEDIQSMPHFIKQAKQELKQAAKSTALDLKKKNPNTDWKANSTRLDKEFDELWRKKTKELEEKFSKTKISDKVIDEALDKSLSGLLLETEHSKTYKSKIKDFFKQFTNWMSSGSRDEITATSELEKTLSACLRELRKHKHMKPFHQNHVDTVLTKMYNTLKTHKVNSDFLVNSLIKASHDLAKAYKECQAEYEKANSVKALFEKEKKHMRNDFLAFFDETIKIDAAVDRIYSELMTATQDIVLNIINVTLLSKMRTDNCYNNKERLIGKILEELLHKKEAQLYVDFIQRNETFVFSWLREKVKNKLKDGWVITLISEELDKVLRGITTALRETEACSTEHEAGTTFKIWALKFKMQRSISDYSFDVESVAEDFELSDVKGFTNSLTKVVSGKLKKEVQVALQLGNSNVLDNTVSSLLYSKMKKDVAQEILDHLGVCKEVCPFCKVTCHLQISGEHTHVATFHYPQGVAGRRWHLSKDLTASSCTLLMATDSAYMVQEEPKEIWRKYTDYKIDYDSWYIEPIKADKPIHYWMWVLTTLNDEFAKLYDANPAEIPEEWDNVTQKMAMKSLRDNYKHHEN
ncbi:interferon-induced very large GTPase 1-like isoform X2 [Apostichopus japonicus]